MSNVTVLSEEQITMSNDQEAQFIVVINDEEQYSIWAVGRPIPLGWSAVGVTGSKAECLAYIEEVWTDMRPMSLRKAMQNNPE
jgi:MbtH protein